MNQFTYTYFLTVAMGINDFRTKYKKQTNMKTKKNRKKENARVLNNAPISFPQRSNYIRARR